MNKPEILLVDDEQQIVRMLQIAIESNGYKVRVAATGKEGIIMAANHPPECILLDIGLPDMNGLQVLKELRQWYDRAIIILSVQNDEASIVQALDNGASDYLSKPFRNAELFARIRSAIRKNPGSPAHSLIQVGDISIDLSARTVKKREELLKLTSTEFNLLALFAKNEGRVLTHQFLLKEIWGVAYQSETQYLRVFIAALRKKIETDPNHPIHLITESGVGYRFS